MRKDKPMSMKRLLSFPKMFFVITAALICFVAAAPATVMADDDQDDDNDSYFNNPAQAKKAENLSAITVARSASDIAEARESLEGAERNDGRADQNLDEKQDAYDDAYAGLQRAAGSRDPKEVREFYADNPDDPAVENFNEARDDLDRAKSIKSRTENAVDEAEQDLREAMSGVVSEEEIAEMRATMGWGEIAHELGIHPSALGLGHKYGHNQDYVDHYGQKKEYRERNMAAHRYGQNTARDPITGGAKSYGQSRGRGKGAGTAGGIGKSAGIGSSRGGKGNSGNANGGGNGGGNSGGNGKK